MERRCAWCGSALDHGRASPEDAPVSHGICGRCAGFLTRELGVPLDRFLESLDAPVFLVDVSRGARVRMASRQGLTLVDRGPGEVADELLGDVFECAFATLPEGCGRTVHCSGCTIRKSVEHTWKTGEALVRVPATLEPRDERTPVVTLEISTEKVADEVLLRIDDARPALRPLGDDPTS